VRVINAYQNFHLGLSPKAGAVGRAQADAGIEVGVGVLIVGAGEFDSRFVIGFGTQVVIRQKVEADLFGAGHLVFGMERHPLSAGADAVTFIRIRAKGAALSADRERYGAK